MTETPKITDYSKVQSVVITLPAAWALTAPDEDTLKAMLATKDNEARQSRNEVEEKRSRGAATPLPMIEPGQVVILGWRPWRLVRPGGRRALAAHWRGMGPFCQKQTVWASEQGEGRAVEVRYLVAPPPPCIERATALRLTDVVYNANGGWESEQYEPLAEGNYNGIQDNGGEPDGNAWLIWHINQAADDAKAAIALGAEVVGGFEAEYEGREFGEYVDGQFTSGDEWSGIQSASTAFFVNETDARLCAAFTAALRDTDDPELAQLLCNSEKYAVEVH